MPQSHHATSHVAHLYTCLAKLVVLSKKSGLYAVDLVFCLSLEICLVRGHLYLVYQCTVDIFAAVLCKWHIYVLKSLRGHYLQTQIVTNSCHNEKLQPGS